MKKTVFVIPLMIIIVVALIAASPKPSTPEMIDLGTLNGPYSYGYAINYMGQIAGNSGDAFLWENGVMTGIGQFYVIAMNDVGQIVGHTADPSGDNAVIWQNGELTSIIENSDWSIATGVNKLGQVVGVMESDKPTFFMDGFLWENGTVQNLGPIVPQDINSRGQIVGFYQADNGETHAFLLENGVLTDLGDASSYSAAGAINKQGWIVGVSGDNMFELNATLWKDGEVIDLGTLGGERSNASAINDCGQVVGGAHTATGEWHAFLWEDGQMIDLGTLGGAGSGANDINNFGQITGSSDTADGEYHAFLWTGDAYWLKENIRKCKE